MKAIITGASSGIGSEVVRILNSRNIELVLVGRSEPALLRVAQSCQQAQVVCCDLAVSTEIDNLLSAHPHADILVNCAGYTELGSFLDRDWSKHQAILQVNAIAVARLCHHYVAGMKQQGHGEILNISSSSALSAAPSYAIYSASKSFVLQFSRSLAAELVGTNVKVACLVPGPTATAFCDRAGLREAPDAMSAAVVAAYGLQMLAQGKVVGTPGWNNRVKQLIKRLLPEGIGAKVARQYADWRKVDAKG
jgi:uncharacterized protein